MHSNEDPAQPEKEKKKKDMYKKKKHLKPREVRNTPKVTLLVSGQVSLPPLICSCPLPWWTHSGVCKINDHRRAFVWLQKQSNYFALSHKLLPLTDWFNHIFVHLESKFCFVYVCVTFFFFSIWYLWPLGYCLACNKCSINSFWVLEWMSEWMNIGPVPPMQLLLGCGS